MPGVPTIKLPSWYGVSEDTQLADFSSVSDLTSSILFILQACCKCYSLVYIVIIVEKKAEFSLVIPISLKSIPQSLHN